MKGTFIFNHVNDIVFINIDESYKGYINQKAFEQGQITDKHAKTVDPDVIFHNFSPLVASLRVMRAQLESAYNTIQGQDGYLVVLKEFSDYVYVAVNGDGEETEEFLQRKLRVLHRIVTFLHGPCLELLRPNKPKERTERWKVIGDLLMTWSDLHSTEQTFLVEATERLHINEQVNKTCVELLEGALSGMRGAGEKHAVHAMLVTRSKLMALFSSRHATDLTHGDQLMLLLLVNTLFRGVKVTGAHSHLATLSSREMKKRPKVSRGPLNISRQNSRTPLLEGGETTASGTDDTTDSEIVADHSDSYTSSDDTRQRTHNKGSMFQVSSESPTDSSSAPNRVTDSPPITHANRTPSPYTTQKAYSKAESRHSERQRDLSPAQEVVEEVEPNPVNQVHSDISSAQEVLEQVESSHVNQVYNSDKDVAEEKERPISVSQGNGDISPAHNMLSDSSRTSSRAQSHNRSSSVGSRRSSQQKARWGQSCDPASMPPLSVVSKSSSGADLTSHTQHTSSFEHIGANSPVESPEEPTNQLSDKSHMQDTRSPKQRHFKHSLSASFLQSSSHKSRTAIQEKKSPSANVFERSHNSGMFNSSFGAMMPEVSLGAEGYGSWGVSSLDEEVMDYDHSTVLLAEGGCDIVPHSVHSVLIMEGVYLVIVCQLARVTHAQTIAQALTTVNSLLEASERQASQPIKTLADSMDSSVKKLGDILKKSKGVLRVERIILDISSKWDQAKQCDIVKLLATPQQQDANIGRLTGALSTLQEKIHQLFQELYLTHRHSSSPQEQSVLSGIGKIQGRIRSALGDYRDYIGIMAHRNMPMSIYIDEFPGMVHFIFVNRTSNVMVAPSFHTNLYADEDRTHHTSELVKQKVWQVYSWMRERLAEGVFTVTMREADFHFSYFVWFEDNQGGFPLPLPNPSSTKPGSAPLSPAPISPVLSSPAPLPGVICEPFYSRLQTRCFPGMDRKQVSCYELFCVHVSMVPSQHALGHCRKLKEKLWRVSVDTSAPISLL